MESSSVLTRLLVVLYLSTSHAVYNNANRHNNKDGGVPLISDSNWETRSSMDRVAWEYLVQKYSTSGKGFSQNEIFRMISSMQMCEQSGNRDSDQTDTGNQPGPSSEKKLTLDGEQTLHCARVMDSMMLFGRGGSYFNQSSFKEVCPRLLFYLGNKDCCGFSIQSQAFRDSISLPNVGDGTIDQGTSTSTTSEPRSASKKDKPSPAEVWGYGILLVTIISCSSLLGVSLMPFMAKEFYKHLLTVMIGLAVGSLTGSAVFHLIPQALRLDERDPHHGYLHISLVIVGGIWLFFMVERILKMIMDYKEQKGINWKREKMSSITASAPESSTVAVVTENGNLMKGTLVTEQNGDQRNSLIYQGTPTARDAGVIYECQEQAIKASFGHQEKPRASTCHDHHVTFRQGKDSVIATVAWMIIFGDGLHNFIDGLSIGAAFNESIWTGVSISVAVLCEELPHELGDFAVLLNAGMSVRQALTYNFLSACTCYIGMAVGIFLGEVEANVYIFALAGGMFLYISLVDMVPEMNEIAQETSKLSFKKGLIILLLQNLGLFAGITTLYLLALYQDRFQF